MVQNICSMIKRWDLLEAILLSSPIQILKFTISSLDPKLVMIRFEFMPIKPGFCWVWQNKKMKILRLMKKSFKECCLIIRIILNNGALYQRPNFDFYIFLYQSLKKIIYPINIRWIKICTTYRLQFIFY